MFKDLAHFSSFVESIIALLFFLSVWKKPEEIFSHLLEKSFSNEKILLTEKKFLIDSISNIFNGILRFARLASIIIIPCGLTILFLSGSCNYDDSQSICKYPIVDNYQSIAILLLFLSPILLNLTALILGLFYYIMTYALILVMKAKASLTNITSKRKENKEKLSMLSEHSIEDLKEIIKNAH